MKNMKNVWHKFKGVTLVEMLLVLVIITSILVVAGRYFQQRAEDTRIERTVLQMNYILNAGLAYYVAHGTWPGSPDGWYRTDVGATPLAPDYLPDQLISNPWGLENFYWHYYTPTSYPGLPPNTFQVWVYMGTSTRQQTLANILAAKFPFAYVTQSTDTYPGYVVAYVNIPAQELNNAMAVTFAGLYHHGACVPVPICPTTAAGAGTNMQPQIFVVPVSVSGVNDSNTSNIYPISSFTAFATKMSDENDTPDACPGNFVIKSCDPTTGTPESHRYWRVCLQVVTQKGDVQITRRDEWGNMVTLGAFTRCAITNEPSGSDFSVYTH